MLFFNFRGHWNCHAYCWKCMFEEGIGALGAYCKEKKWNLFTPRPKLHMQQEIMNLWRTYSTRMGAASVCMHAWVRILVRMWMQDQLDAGAEFVLSPNCHEPSIWKHKHAWHIVLQHTAACCGIHDGRQHTQGMHDKHTCMCCTQGKHGNVHTFGKHPWHACIYMANKDGMHDMHDMHEAQSF